MILLKILFNFFLKPKTKAPVPVVVPSASVTEQNTPMPEYLFSTQEESRHSIRVICDEEGLSFSDKNIITASIYQESEYWNILPSGNPVKHDNGTSIDWGIVEINDTKGWYIGPAPLPFPSVQFLLDNPEKAVRFMIKMFKQGQLKKWVSYSSGAYKQWLPYATSPVPASGHYPVHNMGGMQEARGTIQP